MYLKANIKNNDTLIIGYKIPNNKLTIVSSE